MFRVSNTPIIRSTQNCNYSLRYWSYFFVQLPPSNVAKLGLLPVWSWWILCLWFRASLIYINNCPTRCNTKQSIYYSASSLYMFRVSTTPIMSTQNCTYSLRYWSYFLFSNLATLEGGICTKNMTSTGGCSYSFVYSWWWVWLTPETCRLNLQNNK